MNNEVAIIGMAGRFPLANHLGAFYANLRQGKNCVRPISRQRRLDSSLPPRNYIPWGFLEGIDRFDFGFFGISQAEAELMDPNQRLTLEVVYETLENAGCHPDDLSGSRTQVYFSGPEFVYHKLIQQADPMKVTGNSSAITAGRISRYFNLTGGAMLIDTTCSSSLVAVHLACQDLLRGQCDYALVAGAGIVLFPPVAQDGPDLGVMSPDGKARAFDSQADGSSGGEALACVLLRRAPDARRDGDIVHAIIKGSAINHDANRSSFLTAPSKVAQAEVIAAAWKNAAVDPRTVTYVEAHGTGTKLGDPIEMDGLNLAFQAHTSRRHFCAVSALKTNIGHTDRVAGLAGLIKATLSLKHRELFPSLHFRTPNPLIDFENSAVYVNTEWREWPASPEHPRRAGVSAFGLSGTNCHVVLEEAAADAAGADAVPAASEKRVQLGCVSAKSPESLRENIRALYQWLEGAEGHGLLDVAYTLNRTRRHYPYRYAFVASEVAEARNQLAEAIPADYALAPCPERPGELILLFGGDTWLPAAALAALRRQYPAFGQAYQQCLAACPGVPADSPPVQAFVHQYSLFKCLEALGIASENLLGVGPGERIVEVVTGELSLAEGIAQAARYGAEASANLAGRLLSYINREAARKKLLFAEVGSNGLLARTLGQLRPAPEQFSVSTFDFQAADPVLDLLRALYLEGYQPDWEKLYRHQPARRRIELPTYQFQKSRAWAREGVAENPVEQWLYDMDWTPAAPSAAAQPLKGEVLLVVMDAAGLGDALVTHLSAGNTVIRLHLAHGFEQLGAKEYRVGIDAPGDYQQLEKHLVREGYLLTGIVALNAYGGSPVPETAAAMEAALTAGIYAHFHLARAFAHHLPARHFRLVCVTSHGSRVLESDPLLPTRALPAVFLKALLAEYPLLRVHSVDVEGDNPEMAAQWVLQEMGLDERLRFVAYRGPLRYVPVIRPLKVEKDRPAGQDSPAQPAGAYLISGGATGIGFETAQLLAQRGPVHLIMLGRTVLPAADAWAQLPAETPEAVRIRVENLQALQALGASVEYHAADVAQAAQVAGVLDRIGPGVGQLRGIIHSAGVPGKRQLFSQTSFADFKAALGAKLYGTMHLEQVSQALRPGFFLIFSSLNSVVPHKYTLDYAVANAFEDAFALSKAGSDRRYIAIGWPGWYETGMSLVDGKVPVVDKLSPLQPISTEDGLKALEYALRLNRPNVRVADIDLNAFAINPYFLVEQAARGVTERPAPRQQERPAVAADASLTPAEAVVAAIWRDVLKVKQIDPDADFFDLGGHSLNGTQVMNRIEKELGLTLELETLFEFATIRTLAAHLDQLAAAGKTVAYESIAPAPRQEYYDTSHAQRRLWFIHQYQPGLTAYNLPFAFELEGLNPEAFARAFRTLEERHESLRTTFVNADGLPRQQIHAPGTLGFAVQVYDLRAFADRGERARRRADEEAVTPFDLEKGPLLRATLLQLEANRYVFLFTMHHLISDGWSLEVLVREISALYTAYANGRANPLPPLRVQYKDVVYWQQGLIRGKDQAYWLSKLSGELRLLPLPYDVEYAESNTFRGGRVHARIEADVTARLRELALQHGTSLSTVVLSVFNILLAQVSGQEDIALGMAVANRTHLDTEGLIGFFVNTLIIRNTISGEMSFEEVLARVSQSVVEAYEHQNYPFDLLVEKLNPERLGNRQSLFNVMYAFQNYAGVALGGGDGEAPVFEARSPAFRSKVFDQTVSNAYFDLTHFVNDEGQTLLVGFNYNSDLFEEATVAGLLESYREFLALTASIAVAGAEP